MSDSAGANGAEKPAVLIIGGLGYVGRFLALHIHNNNLASEVRLVDKQLPELAWLAPEFAEACSRAKFIQADASKEVNLSRIFTRSNGHEFDYVFNCGGETRYSQDDEVYKARSYTLSTCLGTEAARRKIKCFLELSTGMVYKPKEKPRKEGDDLKPWLKLAKWKLQAERDLAKIEGLRLCVLRLGHVYGSYTSKYLAMALCLARVWQHEGETMKWLWGRDLRNNTVHVEDVARGMWHAAEWYCKSGDVRTPPPIFNLVDQGNTSQGTLADILQQIFNVPQSFEGSVRSKIAMLKLDNVVDELNDDTLDIWAELQQESKTSETTPLNPFMEKELLKDNHLSLDGTAFVKETGFQYKHPTVTKQEVEAVIESYKRMNWWP
ncbi:NAD dependent epimerase/dehydratase family protein [Venturia nashicola]|uniref:NAD dependent epimerase/dehydratase family protein n=1 Tax=Venturia nashicola TaxID=86259 RepID=A0A4Z1NL83_9PEZI|nr:NAD dependent epimerase/dehydratase family protein [Venturia nashicola]